MTTGEIAVLLRFHKDILTLTGHVLDPSVRQIEERTIKALEELYELKGGGE